jgi:hypothetical protein
MLHTERKLLRVIHLKLAGVLDIVLWQCGKPHFDTAVRAYNGTTVSVAGATLVLGSVLVCGKVCR